MWSKLSSLCQRKSEKDYKATPLYEFSKGDLVFGGMMVGAGVVYQFSEGFREFMVKTHPAYFLAIGAVSSAACLLYERLTKPYFLSINEIKFVSYTNKPCRGHIYGLSDCTERMSQSDPTFSCSYTVMRWIINVFDSAKETLDIAIYLVTCDDLKKAIMRAHKRGVRIRLIADHIMSHGTGSVVPQCIIAGIPVRMNVKEKMMHRKSVVIDNKVLFIGTGNWTMQALAGNCETWLKTNDPPLVEEFIAAFQAQWEEEGVTQPTIKEFEDSRRFIN